MHTISFTLDSIAVNLSHFVLSLFNGIVIFTVCRHICRSIILDYRRFVTIFIICILQWLYRSFVILSFVYSHECVSIGWLYTFYYSISVTEHRLLLAVQFRRWLCHSVVLNIVHNENENNNNDEIKTRKECVRRQSLPLHSNLTII